jgi:branched-chain amino acid aminotransferase
VIVWIDGELLDLRNARISPLDRGLTVGDGVFETLRVYGGTPFAWRRHTERLAYSAAGLGLALPDPAVLRTAADAVLAANGLTEARLRVTVTGGEGPPGSSRAGAVPRAFMVAVPFEPATATTRATIAPWTRNERSATAGLKTISYAANVRALAYAQEHGAEEALFANTSGNLCEATGSNVFVVRDGVALTPPPSAGCLPGVTRGLLLELAPGCGVEAHEADLPMSALASVSEVFLTSTTREVQALDTIVDPPPSDATPSGETVRARHLDAPGPVAVCLADAFRELVARDLDP